MTASAMAERTGLRDRKSWERYERDENAPRAEALTPLIHMGISARWLLTGQGRMFQGHPFDRNATEPDAPTLDAVLLQGIIDTIETELAVQKRSLTPARRALLISEIYAMAHRNGTASARDPDHLRTIVIGMLNVMQ